MPSAALELDVRGLPPPKRHPEIFRILNSLGPSGGFVLVNDHDPKPLLSQLQMERPGRFDWNVLEAGPLRFRIEIRRRDGGARTVTEYLEGDHRRLDAILEQVENLASSAAFQEASERFAEFACGLGRHIDLEEQILFPEFEKASGNACGPTFVMRSEHAEIRQLMDRIQSALEASDVVYANSAVEELEELLSLHNMKEERMLYPSFDRMVGDERARDDMVRRLQAHSDRP